MGNQQLKSQYENIEQYSHLSGMRDALKLSPRKNKTFALNSFNFTETLRKNSGELSRSTNPFCPMEIAPGRRSGDYEWMTCCLISPIMAIASPRVICDQNSDYYREAKICGIGKDNQIIEVPIQSVHEVEEYKISLIVLEFPVLQLGWAGVTYLQKSQLIMEQTFRVIDHPKRQIKEDDDSFQYLQQMQRVTYKVQNDFCGEKKMTLGSIVFKLIEQKPYIVGIQVSNSQTRFFDKKIFDKIQETAKHVINQRKETQILNQISSLELELVQSV